jgi:serine/threonine protein kinase
MNVDVKIGNRLAGKFGKEYYEAEWIPRKDRSILFLIMNDETAKHEVPFYQQCHHAHIVQTFGLVRNNPRLTTLVQERALHGNLQTLLQNNQFQPSSSVLVKIFLQIIDAMTYLVDQMIIHGDLRCENVLVFQMHSSKPKKNLVKLTNFNLARRNDPSFVDTRRIEIPVQYCAPELLQNTDQLHYSELSDVYSMGTLMWEAYSKRSIPYRSSMNDGERLLQPTGCDDQIWNIIQDCWHNEPQLRFNFREMHTLLSNISIM